MISENAKAPVIVVGDGWAALGAVGFIAAAGRPVFWLAGTGARLLPPLPVLEVSGGATAWRALAQAVGLECEAPESGSFLREYRNKSFREPAWSRAPSPEARADVLAESLWAPELRLAPAFEARFSQGLDELEAAIRARLLDASAFPHLSRREGVPVTGFEGLSVLLGSGEAIPASQVVYADRWAALPRLSGLPKPLGLPRKLEPSGALQVALVHRLPIGEGVREAFFAVLHREAGEAFDRRVWGSMSPDGLKSLWTVCLDAGETEDNHAIGKKLRKLKAALDRMFTGTWLPEGATSFAENVADETVRFEENILFASGEDVQTPIELPRVKGMTFLTDGFGPSSALLQAARACGIEISTELAPEEGPKAQAESVNGPAAPLA